MGIRSKPWLLTGTANCLLLSNLQIGQFFLPLESELAGGTRGGDDDDEGDLLTMKSKATAGCTPAGSMYSSQSARARQEVPPSD